MKWWPTWTRGGDPECTREDPAAARGGDPECTREDPAAAGGVTRKDEAFNQSSSSIS